MSSEKTVALITGANRGIDRQETHARQRLREGEEYFGAIPAQRPGGDDVLVLHRSSGTYDAARPILRPEGGRGGRAVAPLFAICTRKESPMTTSVHAPTGATSSLFPCCAL